MFSFWRVPSSLQMQQGKTKGDVMLIYSLVKNWAITLKRKSEREEYGGKKIIIMVVILRVCVRQELFQALYYLAFD